MLRSARTAAELESASTIAQELVRAHPDLPELRLLVGEIHYRASRWASCASAYRAAGPSGPEDPTQRFYMAVCLYEAGDRAAAAEIASSGLDRLPRTSFVQAYLERFAAARR
jgi:predicted Zn-dependent protease